jgi:transketolase
MSEIKSIRKSILQMMAYSKSSHIGSCLSIVELLWTLYFKVLSIDAQNPADPQRDKFILSKGHASAALYATLAERGFFDKKLLNKFYIDNGVLPGHLDIEAVPGVEASTGSLGHGLSIGLGMAIANRLEGNPGKVFVLLGDGECNEGSVWEAVMLSSHLKLDNITAIIDFNRLQGFGRTSDIIDQSNMVERWKAFRWETYETDGHNTDSLEKIFRTTQKGPKAVIARTVKGKGVSFMEDRLEWHYKSPNEEELQQALHELGNDL